MVADSLPSPICCKEIRKTIVDMDVAAGKVVELLVWHVDFDVNEINISHCLDHGQHGHQHDGSS